MHCDVEFLKLNNIELADSSRRLSAIDYVGSDSFFLCCTVNADTRRMYTYQGQGHEIYKTNISEKVHIHK